MPACNYPKIKKVRKTQHPVFTAKQWNNIMLILHNQCYGEFQPKEDCWDNPEYHNSCHAYCMRKIFIEAGAIPKEGILGKRKYELN